MLVKFYNIWMALTFIDIILLLQIVFHEFVSILAVLVDTFGDQPSFEDLKPLRDKDLDADFFENVKHIQVRQEYSHQN